jgi:hypothetical protein
VVPQRLPFVSTAIDRLAGIVRTLPRASLVAGTESYPRAEFRSAVFRFVDETRRSSASFLSLCRAAQPFRPSCGFSCRKRVTLALADFRSSDLALSRQILEESLGAPVLGEEIRGAAIAVGGLLEAAQALE